MDKTIQPNSTDEISNIKEISTGFLKYYVITSCLNLIFFLIITYKVQ